MSIFTTIFQVLLIYWIISAVVRFIRTMRGNGSQNTHVRGDGTSPNRPVDPDMPAGDIEDADFEEIRDK